MAERRRQEVWNRINRIGVSLHELADEIQALAAELRTEEGEDFAEFSLDDFTRDFAHALENMSADEETEWSSASPIADEDLEEGLPIAPDEQNWEPVGEGLAFSQDDLSAALAEVHGEPAEAPVATGEPEEELALVAPLAEVDAEPSVYLAPPANETESIDDILATLKTPSTEVEPEAAAPVEPSDPVADDVMSELDEALSAVAAESEDTWTEVSADAPLMAQDELAAALSALESGETEAVAAEPNVISLEETFSEPEPEPELAEDPKVIEQELAFEPAPAKPAPPAPSDGGMILSEDEIAALLAEAQARAEDVDEEPIFNENGEMTEAARFMTELRGEAQPEAASPAEETASSNASGINPHAVQKVPASLALSALAMPVEIEGDQIVLHAAVPLDQIGIAMIGQATGLKPKIVEKPLPEVLELLRHNYQDPHAPVEAAPRLTNIS